MTTSPSTFPRHRPGDVEDGDGESPHRFCSVENSSMRGLLVVAVVLCGLSTSHAAVDVSNWMRDMMPIIGNATIMDLTMPGW